MTAPTYPGVYIQEISGGVRPVDPAGTSTAAFVGLAEMGPTTGAQRVTSWTEFQRRFGGFITDGYLAHSVFRTSTTAAGSATSCGWPATDAVAAAVTVQNRAATAAAGLTFPARSEGAWGNAPRRCRSTTARSTRATSSGSASRRQADPAVVPATFRDITPLEVFDNLSIDPAAPNYRRRRARASSPTLHRRVGAGANTSVQRGVHRGGARAGAAARHHSCACRSTSTATASSR